MARVTLDTLIALLRSQLVRFGLIGAMNTAFSYGVYAFGLYIGLAYYLASIPALMFGIALSFVTQGRYVFQAQLKGRFLSFVTMWGLLYLINIGLIRLLAGFGLDHYMAGLSAAVPVVIASFLLQKFIIFRR